MNFQLKKFRQFRLKWLFSWNSQKFSSFFVNFINFYYYLFRNSELWVGWVTEYHKTQIFKNFRFFASNFSFFRQFRLNWQFSKNFRFRNFRQFWLKWPYSSNFWIIFEKSKTGRSKVHYDLMDFTKIMNYRYFHSITRIHTQNDVFSIIFVDSR